MGPPVVGCFIVVVPWVFLGGLLVLMSVLLLVVFLSLFSVRVVVLGVCCDCHYYVCSWCCFCAYVRGAL